MQKFEYKFVRLGEGWLAVKGEAKRDHLRATSLT